MTVRVLVYGEEMHRDGLPVGMPEYKFEGDLEAQSSNSDSWPAAASLSFPPPRKGQKMVVVITDVPLEMVITYRGQSPDAVVAVPVVPVSGQKAAYTSYARGGHMRVWLRGIDS